MTLDRAVRISLWVTAPLNLVAGFTFAFPGSALGSVVELPHPTHGLYAALSGGMVALFGAVYFWLALQTEIHRPLLFLGAAGKSLAVLVALSLFANGQLPAVTTSLLCGDTAFALLWFSWLLKGRSSGRTQRRAME